MRWGRGTIVVGAGVVGLSAAYYLAALGEMVTVLDRGFPGTGASGDNLGQLSLMDRDERMQFSWCMESIALYRELEEEEGIDTERNECGGLLLLGTEEQREIALSLVHSHQKRGLQVGFLDTKGIKDIEPHFDAPSLLGALYCPREGSIMPLKTLNGLTEAARRRGVSFRFRTEVTALALAGDRVLGVHTRGGMLEADRVLVAAGAWTGILAGSAGMEIPLSYHKGAALVTAPVPPCINSVVVSGGFLLKRKIERRVTGLGIAQHRNGSLLIGQATERGNNFDRSLSPEGIREIIINFLSHFPGLKELEVLRAWAGNTPYTNDGAPIFGYSERFSNLFFAAGLKGAFSTALGAGKMAAQMITGDTDAALQSRGIDSRDLEAMEPERSVCDHG